MDFDFEKRPELMEQLTIDVMLCFAIYTTANAIPRFYRKTLDKLGLTYLQYLVMMVLWETKGTTMKALGQRLQLNSSTLTPVVKKLESRGLVARARNKEDERVLDLAPTAAGLALRKVGCQAALAMAAHSGETLETQAELRARLARIREALDRA